MYEIRLSYDEHFYYSYYYMNEHNFILPRYMQRFL